MKLQLYLWFNLTFREGFCFHKIQANLKEAVEEDKQLTFEKESLKKGNFDIIWCSLPCVL